MPTFEIYTRPGCGYCTHAKRLLTNKGVAFTEYDVYQQPEMVSHLRARTTGRTYPQIFINGNAIGGFTELLNKEKNGSLATLTKI
jgi:glutaredoxin 3